MTLLERLLKMRREFELSSLLHKHWPASGARRSKMAAAQTNSSLSENALALRRHFDEVILPMWTGPGFNPALGLPFESLDGTTGLPLPVVRYRAMACARQLFVYARAAGPANLLHATRLFESLCHYFKDTKHGGWRYSVDAQGAPLDSTQDLYTHAFIVFACAAYFQRSRNADARKIMLSTAQTIETRFRLPGGLYQAALNADWTQVLRGPAQNPMMHLTEAYLAAAQLAEPSWFANALRGIGQTMTDTFLHAPTQCIAEAPIGTPGNRLEPGHQFEWLSLVLGAPEVFDDLAIAHTLPRAVNWSRKFGVDAANGGVVAALNEKGDILDGTQRIWAQTEFVRTLANLGDHTALAVHLAQFRTRFIRVGGWFECLNDAGGVARSDMPSTSPYHLATAYQALPDVAQLHVNDN